jgi:hypothetical protein
MFNAEEQFDLIFGLFVGFAIVYLLCLLEVEMGVQAFLAVLALAVIAGKMAKIDPTGCFPILNVFFSVISTFTFLRVIMSSSRSVVMTTPYDSNRHKQVIIFLSVLDVIMIGYVFSTYFTAGDFDQLAQICAGWHAINFIVTLYCENGIISDFLSVVLASTVWLARAPEYDSPRDCVTVMRILFLVLKLLGPLFVLPHTKVEDQTFLFRIEKAQTRFALSGLLGSYFLLCPSSMWTDGCKDCPLQALLVPALYTVFMVYEQYNSFRESRRRFLF